MNEKLTQERLEKSRAKLAKLENTLAKYDAKLRKIFDKYTKSYLVDIMPVDIFVGFDLENRYNWGDEQKLESEIQRVFNKSYSPIFVYNRKATRYIATLPRRDSQLIQAMRDANDVAEAMANKREEIKDTKSLIKKYSDALDGENNKKRSVEELFEQVPQLKEFIEQCGERQYQYMVEYNIKLKKRWDEYYKLDRECCDLWNTGKPGNRDEYRARRKEADRVKPKTYPRTEEQIKYDVESWKLGESSIMAERLKTEFGKIISTTLYLGADGNVNGIIVGENRTARIETIFAGGYNIQCLHTRLLVHEK